MSLIETTLKFLQERKDRIDTGKTNCIESPFQRFSNDFVGLEKDTYSIVTSYTKGSKTQFTSYLLYDALMKAYTKKAFKMKVIYINLEETKERILTRFISWLIYKKSRGKYRYSPRQLRSTVHSIPQEVLDYINSEEIQGILNFFEETFIFPEDVNNPTGIYKFVKNFMEERGTVTTKPAVYKDDLGVLHNTQTFDSYTPNDSEEYIFVVVDTINLVDSERGYTKKQAIDKLSEYMVLLRNRYHVSPIVIQQQSVEGESNESVKLGKVRPSIGNLGDSKYSARDANLVLGIFSPYKFDIKSYMGYDISILKDHFRTLEVIVSRDGECGGLIPLYFDGAVCDWFELPKTDDNSLKRVYEHVKNLEGKKNIVLFIKSLLTNFNHGK